jgi:hypothetical protein
MIKMAPEHMNEGNSSSEERKPCLAAMESSITTTTDNDPSERWVVDSMVSAATTINKMFTLNTCRLCQVYTDKQVEYECKRQDLIMPAVYDEEEMPEDNPVGRAIGQAAAAAAGASAWEVEIYRQFLFDEASVVENVSLRGGWPAEEEGTSEKEQEMDCATVMTQRTQ